MAEEIRSPHTPDDSYHIGDFHSAASGSYYGGGGATISALSYGGDFASIASGSISAGPPPQEIGEDVNPPVSPLPTSEAIGPSTWDAPGRLLNGTHYILSGPETGKLVVCVPGIGGYHIHYDLLAPALEHEGYRVLRYDLIGRGFSEPQIPNRGGIIGCASLPQQPYDLHRHIQQLADLIEGLDLIEQHKNFHLIGHSMGGAISICYTQKYHEHVASLLLLSPAGLMTNTKLLPALKKSPGCIKNIVKSNIKRRQEKAIRNDFLHHFTAVENRVVKQYQMMYANNGNAFQALFQCILDFPLSGLDDIVREVADRKLPILLAWGIWDRVIPYDPHFQLWKQILQTGKNVRYEAIESGGHGFLLETPDRTNDTIIRFLKAPPYWLPPSLSFANVKELSPISI